MTNTGTKPAIANRRSEAPLRSELDRAPACSHPGDHVVYTLAPHWYSVSVAFTLAVVTNLRIRCHSLSKVSYFRTELNSCMPELSGQRLKDKNYFQTSVIWQTSVIYLNSGRVPPRLKTSCTIWTHGHWRWKQMFIYQLQTDRASTNRLWCSQLRLDHRSAYHQTNKHMLIKSFTKFSFSLRKFNLCN